jgi:outer membrane protein
MKKIWVFFFVLVNIQSTVWATPTNLIQVYEQALANDAIYQQALEQRLSDREAAPISRAALLPQITAQGGPSLDKANATDSAYSTTTRGYSVTLNVTQSVFDYSKFANFTAAKAIGKQADATLNAAVQNLMTRVATAYFAILLDEDNLTYIHATQKTYSQQLDQVNQQFKVGLKTITELDTARAAFDNASALYIAAETQLANDKENLRAMTGNTYPSLAKLNKKFPLITPQPANMETWVQTAAQQNWAVKAAQYAAEVKLANIKQQHAGHYPTVNLQGSYNVSYASSINNQFNPIINPNPLPATQGHLSDATVSLNLGIPIFAGGAVISQTNKAKHDYQIAYQQLEQVLRNTTTMTRQSYMNIIAGIRKLNADKQTIKSTISSYEGLAAGYQVGTQTLIDTLNQQQKIFEAETAYATDRYAYVNNLLALKNAAGTLSYNDLAAINTWLINDDVEKNHIAITSHHLVQTSKKTALLAANKKSKQNKKSKAKTIAAEVQELATLA